MINVKSGYILTVIFLMICMAYVATMVQQYALLGPNINYDDGTYYYVIGSISVTDGSNHLRMAHPGVNLMLLGSWFYSVLHFFSVVEASSFSQLATSADPVKTLFDLTVWAKILSGLICSFYLALVFLIIKFFTNSKILAGIAVLFNFFYLGLLEQMFILRPETLSVVFILSSVYLLAKPFHPLRGSFVFGFFLSSLFLAKLNAVFFVPVLFYFYFRSLSQKKLPVKFLSCILYLFLGGMASLFLFAINLATNPFLSGGKFLALGVGQTLYYTFFTQSVIASQYPSFLSFLFNSDLSQIARQEQFFLLATGLGMYCAEKKTRLNLLALSLLLILLSFFNVIRGGSFSFYYRIYFLPIESLMLAIALMSFWNYRFSPRLKVCFLAFFAFFLVKDSLHIQSYRQTLFSNKEKYTHALGVLEYWERGRFENEILKPRYCLATEDKESCTMKLVSLFENREKQYNNKL